MGVALYFPFCRGARDISFLAFVLGCLAGCSVGTSLSLVRNRTLNNIFTGVFLNIKFTFLTTTLKIMGFFIILVTSVSLDDGTSAMLGVLDAIF